MRRRKVLDLRIVEAVAGREHADRLRRAFQRQEWAAIFEKLRSSARLPLEW